MLPIEAPSAALQRLPPHARVWVYKCDRTLSQAEVDVIRERGNAFVATWSAHGAALYAAIEVLHQRFVIVGVDEAQAMASGCSIDKSVRFIRDLERDLSIVLTDRLVVWYERVGALRRVRLPDLPRMIQDAEITGDTIVFDDLVSTKADLDARFRAPLRATWMSRYL